MRAVLLKPWWAFQKWRLGEDAFLLRVMRSVFIDKYLRKARPVGRQRARAQKSGLGLIVALLGIELWVLKIRLSGLGFGDKADAFVLAIEERQSRAEARHWEALHREDDEQAARERERAERAQREQEWREAERERQRRRREAEREHQRREAERKDPYLLALVLLGLAEKFTQEEFIKAYRRAMMAAHPDAGGSTAKAQAVNAARDLIRKRNGW